METNDLTRSRIPAGNTATAWLKIIALWKVLHPLYESEVVAIVLVPTTSESSCKAFFVVEVERTNCSEEIVFHLFFADKV